jgi:hypothetical protein
MVALQALSGATREFLTKTEAWKPWAAVQKDATADTATVSWINHLPDPVAPADPELQYITLRIETLQWAPTGEEIPFATHDDLQQMDREWRTRTGPQPKFWTPEIGSTDRAVARLVPVPSATVTEALRARLVIITHTYAGIGANATDTLAVELPDDLFHRYFDVLVNGALSRLYRMPGRDWTDRPLSEYHRKLFEDALVLIKSEADNDYTSAPVVVQYGGY